MLDIEGILKCRIKQVGSHLIKKNNLIYVDEYWKS